MTQQQDSRSSANCDAFAVLISKHGSIPWHHGANYLFVGWGRSDRNHYPNEDRERLVRLKQSKYIVRNVARSVENILGRTKV